MNVLTWIILTLFNDRTSNRLVDYIIICRTDYYFLNLRKNLWSYNLLAFPHELDLKLAKLDSIKVRVTINIFKIIFIRKEGFHLNFHELNEWHLERECPSSYMLCRVIFCGFSTSKAFLKGFIERESWKWKWECSLIEDKWKVITTANKNIQTIWMYVFTFFQWLISFSENIILVPIFLKIYIFFVIL